MSLCGEKGLHVSLFNILMTPMWTSSLDLSLELQMSISACLGQAQMLHSGPLEGRWGPHIWPGQNETQCSPSQGPISMKDHQSRHVPSPRKESSSIPPSCPFSTGRQHKSGHCLFTSLGKPYQCSMHRWRLFNRVNDTTYFIGKIKKLSKLILGWCKCNCSFCDF